jgi:hypothetical protein
LTWTELLLGPTFATQKVLQDMKLSLADIGVIEFHEAFAGTTTAVLGLVRTVACRLLCCECGEVCNGMRFCAGNGTLPCAT